MTETKKDEKPAQDVVNSEVQAEVTTKNEEASGESLMDKIRDLSEKGFESLKKGGEKLAHLADSSTKLAKIKLDIHNLEAECGKLNVKAGEKLWAAHKENKLDDPANLFATEFKSMAVLKKKIAALQKQADKISFVE